MNPQVRLVDHLLRIEDLRPGGVRRRVGAPGLPDDAHGTRLLSHQLGRPAPVGLLLLVAAAGRAATGRLLEGSSLPAVDDVGSVIAADEALVVGRDLEVVHEPAPGVAKAVPRRRDRGPFQWAPLHVGRRVEHHGAAGVHRETLADGRSPVRVADRALGRVAVVGEGALGEAEEVGVGVPLVVDVWGVGRSVGGGNLVDAVRTTPGSHDVDEALGPGDGVGDGDLPGVDDAPRQVPGAWGGRASVSSHERHLVGVDEPGVGIRRGRLAVDRLRPADA